MDSIKNVLLALGRYDPRTHRGVALFARRHRWHLNCEMCISGRLPKGWKGDGIITMLDQKQELAEFVQSSRSPVVDLSLFRSEIPLPRVVGNNPHMGEIAAQHFLERGFRQFAWFTVADDSAARLRFEGFSRTLAAAGFGCESWLFQPTPEGDEWTQKSQWLSERLLEIAKPAAIFAFRDIEAANILDACESAGISVPYEISILGVDNNELICESLRVPLSSVNHDLERLGYEGAALLHRLMFGATSPSEPILIEPNGITVRRSTDLLALNDEPTRLALCFLRENYRKPISAEDAVAVSGMGRREMEKRFREHIGRSMRSELANIRMAKAKELLIQTELSITDIAARTGHNTVQYFTLVFNKANRMTPRQYRLKHFGKL